MADNLQNKAVEQAVNYFQVSELQFIIFCLLILVLWFIGTYYLQSRFQKNVMKDIALQKEKIEKRLRNIDYKNDYYKKIIDKRMMAYEELERFLSEIDVESDYCLNNLNFDGVIVNVHCYIYFDNRNKFQNYLNKSVEICGYNSWYSKEMEKWVNRLNKDLAAAFGKVTNPVQLCNGIKIYSKKGDLDIYDILISPGFVIDSKCTPEYPIPLSKFNFLEAGKMFLYVRAHDAVIGQQWYKELNYVIQKIRQTMIADRLELHEVEKFLNEKK